jgi:uncharacterized protein (DUF305 family)
MFVNSLLAASLLGSGACKSAEQPEEHLHDSPAMKMAPIPEDAYYIAADVQFMQGMIAHHGQAVVMAKMAPTHGANAQLLLFTQKIDLSQRGEIEIMERWLYERGQPVPDSLAHEHMNMPGMLTAEQLKQLDAAKGKEFDKLFLVLMIQHHEGALKMVADLQATPAAMQDFLLHGFATDVDVDQRAEINRMYQMLEAMG